MGEIIHHRPVYRLKTGGRIGNFLATNATQKPGQAMNAQQSHPRTLVPAILQKPRPHHHIHIPSRHSLHQLQPLFRRMLPVPIQPQRKIIPVLIRIPEPRLHRPAHAEVAGQVQVDTP